MNNQIFNYLICTFCILLTIFALHKYFSGYTFKGVKPNLQGKVAVITGGNTGIGKETVIGLAKQNCRIIIGARDTNKSQQAAQQINKIVSKQLVQHFYLDLGDLKSIQAFASNIKYEKIDYLINNAGMFCLPQRRMTKSGFQMQYGVNHMGHFYLTYLLYPKLIKSNYFKIVNVSALAHKMQIGNFQRPDVNFDDMNFEKTKYSPTLAYSRSKIYNNLFTHALSERIPNQKGLSVSLHPGVVRTQLTRHLPNTLQIMNKLFYLLNLIITKSAKQGAQTTLAMIFLQSNKLKNGGYYSDGELNGQNKCVNKENWDKLWDISEKQLNIKFKCT